VQLVTLMSLLENNIAPADRADLLSAKVQPRIFPCELLKLMQAPLLGEEMPEKEHALIVGTAEDDEEIA
jgi:hypothetical protein